MKKIFTDCDIYEDEWYRELPPAYKLLWGFVCSRSQWGIWKPDIKLASFFLGIEVEKISALKFFNQGKSRIEELRDGRWFIVEFCRFQYGTLTASCPPHRPILKFYKENYPELIERVTATLTVRVQEKEKEKEEEIKGIVKGGRFTPPSLEEVKAAFSEKGFADSEAAKFLAYYESVGWIIGHTRKPMKSWRGAVKTWCGKLQENGIRPKQVQENYSEKVESWKKEAVPMPEESRKTLAKFGIKSTTGKI